MTISEPLLGKSYGKLIHQPLILIEYFFYLVIPYRSLRIGTIGSRARRWELPSPAGNEVCHIFLFFSCFLFIEFCPSGRLKVGPLFFSRVVKGMIRYPSPLIQGGGEILEALIGVKFNYRTIFQCWSKSRVCNANYAAE